MWRKFILVSAMALVSPGSTVQLMTAQLVCFGYVVLVVNKAPYKKAAADFTNQSCNVQIMISLLIAMALKTNLPPPGTTESILFDGLLSASNAIVILIGSYSFFKCLQKRGKTVAKMAGKLKRKGKKTPPSSSKVHPV